MSKRKELKQKLPLHKLSAVASLLVTILPGCGPTEKRIRASWRPQEALCVETESPQQANSLLDGNALLATNIDIDVQTITAKFDVPILFGTAFTHEQTQQSGQYLLCYETDIDQKTITHFYQSEMQRLGWQLLSALQSQESLLVFKKPHSLAILSIRPVQRYFGTGSYTVHIALSPIDTEE